jgi:hypothetical protein
MKKIFIFTLALVAGLFVAGAMTHAISLPKNNGVVDSRTLFSATTTNATSTIVSVAGAKSATFFFVTAGTSTATAQFSVQVSHNNSDWVTYNKLVDNVANTNGQMLTRVASATLTGATAKTYSMDLNGEAYFLTRCVSAGPTGGYATATCAVIINN